MIESTEQARDVLVRYRSAADALENYITSRQIEFRKVGSKEKWLCSDASKSGLWMLEFDLNRFEYRIPQKTKPSEKKETSVVNMLWKVDIDMGRTGFVDYVIAPSAYSAVKAALRGQGLDTDDTRIGTISVDCCCHESSISREG